MGIDMACLLVSLMLQVPDVPRGFAEQLQRAAFEVTGGAADAVAVGKELGSAIADR